MLIKYDWPFNGQSSLKSRNLYSVRHAEISRVDSQKIANIVKRGILIQRISRAPLKTGIRRRDKNGIAIQEQYRRSHLAVYPAHLCFIDCYSCSLETSNRQVHRRVKPIPPTGRIYHATMYRVLVSSCLVSNSTWDYFTEKKTNTMRQPLDALPFVIRELRRDKAEFGFDSMNTSDVKYQLRMTFIGQTWG